MKNTEIIEELYKLDLSSYPYEEVMRLVSQFQTKLLRITISRGCRIERIRPDVGVYERKDVSYRPAIKNEKPQRATLPKKTAFYGTLCHEDESPITNRYIALLESSKLLKDGIESNGEEDYTLSQWITTDEIRLADFVHDSVFQGVNNNQLLEMSKHELEKGKSLVDNVFLFDEYGQFVASQFAKQVKNDYEYIISASIAEMLMYATKLDGVMYPSVQAQGQYGMNIALRPDVADRVLLLQDVSEMKYVQQDGNGHLSFSKKAVPVEMDEHGIKRWKYIEYDGDLICGQNQETCD